MNLKSFESDVNCEENCWIVCATFTCSLIAITSFVYEGVAFKSFSLDAAVLDTVNIYRCYVSKTGKHFVSRDSKCEGYDTEGGLGKIYRNKIDGTLALHRFYQESTGDYLTTTNYQEGINASYRHVGILGFVH